MKQAFLRVILGSAALIAVAISPSRAQFFQQTNLVSDVPGLAARTDPDLKNPWGISFAPTSPFWVSDQVTGKSTLYNSVGVKQGLVVTIPGGNPTGQVFNPSNSFQLSSGGKALFLFATLGGTIAGWNGAQGTTASTVATTPGAAYTGLAFGTAGGNNFLYAANPRGNTVDVFNGTFAPTTLPGNFVDPSLPAGFGAYNVQNLGGILYVTYEDRVNGGGVVNAFDLNGNFLRRVGANASGGVLDSPWGVVIAPASFGKFGGALLIGNKGNGQINAFDPTTDAFLGTLTDNFGNPLANTGLWGLTFGNGGNGGNPNTLYFVAGINGETNGLLGAITPVPEPGTMALLLGLASTGLLAARKMRRRR